MSAALVLPEGLRWDADRNRLKVLSPALADTVLRDPHIITGVDRSRADMAKLMPAEDGVPTITQFFELWYTVSDNYAPFNTELRKVFTARGAEAYRPLFDRMADERAAALPASGDLALDYFSPYFMHSTFAMIGVPEADWPNLTKVARLVIHLFKQQLLGVTEYSEREQAAFAAVMRYLKDLTDRLLADADSPFVGAARKLAVMDPSTWPIAALIGQLLMAGIEPMIVGAAIACRAVWSDPDLPGLLRSGELEAGEVAEEAMRQSPPFGNIFRFVAEPCSCLGVPLEPGTIVAIDTEAVNLAERGRTTPIRGCPVRPTSVLTFGRGTHYCLGANTARLQVAAALRALVRARPDLRIGAVRIDTHNNLKEVRALPYS